MTSYFRNQQETSCTFKVGPCCSSGRDDADWGRNDKAVVVLDNDAELAKEMNQLSVQEREQVLDDIHGVAAATEETPEFVAECIQALDQAISQIPKPKRRLLDRAFFLRPSLQTDDDNKFKLMFLRAEEYNVNKAATRMVKFFVIKSRLFGEENLVKDITLDDLGPHDVEIAVESGCCLVLPQRDNTGRPIITFDISKFDHSCGTEMLRFTWYLCFSATEHDTLAQIRGVATLNYAPLKRFKPIPMRQQMDNMIKSGEMHESLPMRVTGYHFCTDDPKMQFIIKVIRMTHGQQIRLRLRPHFGSELEMEYSLLTFGIHCKSLLTCGDGMTELHEYYLQMRRDKEMQQEQTKLQKEQETGMVLYPEPQDVLIGRGRPYYEYSGSRQLMEMIEKDLERYYSDGKDRLHKTVINMQMVQKIQERGGRFLQRTKHGWKILDEVSAREKTANLFRYRYNLRTGKRGGGGGGVMSKKHPKRTTVAPPPIWYKSSSMIGTKRGREDDVDVVVVPPKLMTVKF